MDKPILLDEAAAIERLRASPRIVLTTHARADGDAVGSMAALLRILRQCGKSATAYLHETILDRYAFLAEAEPLPVWDTTAASDILADADLIVIVDTCSAQQLRNLAEPIRTTQIPTLAIDHHVTRDDVVDAVLVDSRVGACAQIITRLCDRAGWPIDATVAQMLYTGLATDTGWFRFSNADSGAFKTAARLIDAGARPSELYERLFLSNCEARVRLIGLVLSSFELHVDGRLAVIRLTREMIEGCGATRRMTEELINEPQRIGSVVACVLFIEPEADGQPVRVSFRSKRGVDVAELAARFGGGGHERAAGARIDGTIDSVAAQVIPVLVEALQAT